MIAQQIAEAKENSATSNGSIPTFASRPSRAELIARGEAIRKQCPRRSHALWQATPDRPDPVHLVKEGDGEIGRAHV